MRRTNLKGKKKRFRFAGIGRDVEKDREEEREKERDGETERAMSRRQMVALNCPLPKTTHKDFFLRSHTD